ncbi:MAG: hypothetical protein Q8921_12665, partial [Bacteroidota bacterium]|nr:hypothetical protein [Bacteroidota bacterium]
MRKLYIVFLAVLLMGAILSPRLSQAQPYTINQYLLRTTTGSGSSWQPLASGTVLSGLPSYYYNVSSAQPFPFSFRFLNTTYTSSNSFVVNGCGSVILSQTYIGQPYDFEDGYNYGYDYDYGSGQISSAYDIPYDFQYGESGYYYPNYKAAAMEYLNYNAFAPGGSAAQIQWAVLGTAPNRQLVVETLHNHSYYAYVYSGNSTLEESHQVVFFENGISKFQFNYAPQIGTRSTYGWGYGYVSGTFNYDGDGAETGIKETGGQYMMINFNNPVRSYNNGTNSMAPGGAAPVWAYGAGTGQYTLNSAGSRVTYSSYPGYGPPHLGNCNCDMPQVSYMIFIAWPSDFSADFCYMSQSPTGTRPATPYYQPSTQLYPTVQITNQGTGIPTQLTVRFRTTVLGASNYIYTYDSVITAANLPGAFASKLIVFNSPTSSYTTGPAPGSWNIYEDTATVFGLTPTADQAPSDNLTIDEWICSPPHDIKAITVTSFPTGSRTPVAFPASVSIRFKNIGSNTSPETNIPVTAAIKDKSGAVVYRDTVIIGNWPQGVDSNVTFNNFTPQLNGVDTCWGIAIWPTDQLHADDTTKGTFTVAYGDDVQAISVFNPQQDEEKPYYTSWKPGAYFRSVGAAPGEFNVPARVEIRRCSDGQLVFRADSSIPELNIDNVQVPFFFPTVQGGWDISKIPPGCYNICAIARLNNDGDRSNDTACGSFSIIDRLKGDIYVGVGQRFQTLHAAVDSLIYRGVGGNVRLLLADNNYTE